MIALFRGRLFELVEVDYRGHFIRLLGTATGRAAARWARKAEVEHGIPRKRIRIRPQRKGHRA